jgi:small subunit ribosomal protein S15
MRLLSALSRKFAHVTPEQPIVYRVKPKSFFELVEQMRRLTKVQKRWNDVYNQGDTKAPDEPMISLNENFLHGFKKKDFEGRNPLIARALSIANATDGQLLKFKKDASLRKFQRDLFDTGSPQAQVACMTEQIIHNVNHCVRNNQDHGAKRKLVELMTRRMKMLHVLKKTNPNYYIWLVRDFNIQQSQKKVESYRVFARIYKKNFKADKHNRYRVYKTTGFRLKDVRADHYRQKLARLKHD